MPCCSDAGAAAASPLLLYLQYVPGLVVFTHLPPHALSLLDLTRSGPHQVPNKCFKPQFIWRWNLKASHTLSSQPYASITHFTRLHLTPLLQVILDHLLQTLILQHAEGPHLWFDDESLSHMFACLLSELLNINLHSIEPKRPWTPLRGVYSAQE